MRLADLHIAQQEDRIERQKRLITLLEVDGHTDMAVTARQVLTEMTILLAQMQDDLARAEERLMGRRVKPAAVAILIRVGEAN